MDALLKSLLVMLQPLGLAWSLWTLWLLSQRRVMGWRSHGLPLLGWSLLSLFACTPLTSGLLLLLENRHPPRSIKEVPEAPLLVCLGGSGGPSLHEPSRINFSSSVDRVTSSLALMAAGKAQTMLVTGGAYLQDGQWMLEADAIADYLKNILQLRFPIESLGRCSHTHDEAVKVAQWAKQRGLQRVILVTSAVHMPRARACFLHEGLEVEAVPCDYISRFHNPVGEHGWLWIHLPSVQAMQGMASWFHECVGLLVYWWRGWL